MTNFTIREATHQDREWAARLMAGSEPWIRLGRGYDACLAACCARDDELYIGWMDTFPCAFVLVRPRGVVCSIMTAPNLGAKWSAWGSPPDQAPRAAR